MNIKKFKKSELKQMIREELKLIREASNLTLVGANSAQIKTVHSSKLGNASINAKAVWEKVRTKRELNNIIKSDVGKSWGAFEAIAGMDRSNNLFVIRKDMSYSTNWYTVKVDPNGDVMESWTDGKITKSLTHLQGVKDYYIARVGTVKRSPGPNTKASMDNEDRINKVVSKTIDISKKYLEKHFEEIKEEVKEMVIEYIEADDYVSAENLMSNMVRKVSFGDWRNISLRRIITGMDWISVEGALSKEIRNEISNQMSKMGWPYDNPMTNGDIRKIAYTVAIKMKKRIISYLTT